MNVLIIDDDPETHVTVKRMLRRRGIASDSLTNASEALPIAEKGGYDFVLLDYLMPRFTGEWFMEHAVMPRQTQVLLHSSYLSRNIVERMFKLGVTGYVQKPVLEEELIYTLEYHAGIRSRIMETASNIHLDPELHKCVMESI